MRTLAKLDSRNACCSRLARLDSTANPMWGRMSAHQMVCHLNDSFSVGAGTRYASSASTFLHRTVVKWIALRTSFPWPHGVPTRPEIEQGRGGTPPSDWETDRSTLLRWIAESADRQTFGIHPIFGEMSSRDWLAWGYKHVDHHLRQFGV
jgi:hypothetical protein